MKKNFFWLVLSLMTLFLVACGGGEKKEEATDSANANTEISGKIVIYTSMYEDIIDNVSEKLKFTLSLNYLLSPQILFFVFHLLFQQFLYLSQNIFLSFPH